jgi:ribosomal protein S18 acetylase RimI-like enzyme
LASRTQNIDRRMNNNVMHKEIQYEILEEANDKVVNELNALLVQLSKTGRQVNAQSLQNLLKSSTEIITALDDGKIVGCICLAIVPQMGRLKGWVDDMVVDEAYRGQGIAKHLMGQAIVESKRLGCTNLNLTSGDDREAAHGFYESMGFKKRETHVFRLELN